MDNGTFLSCWYARCWYARSAAVSGRPRCARYSLCRRSLTGGSHTHPTLAVAWAVFAANGGRTARALRAPLRRKKRASPHPAAHIAGPFARTLPQEVRRARGPGRSIFAEGAGRAHRSFRSPPAGRFGPSAQVPTGHALPSGALRAAFRIPGAFPKSSIWRRHPARARDRLPASSGRPASLTCAADSAALRQQGYLTPLPAREPSEGWREGSGATPAEKIGASRAFSPRASGIPR